MSSRKFPFSAACRTALVLLAGCAPAAFSAAAAADAAGTAAVPDHSVVVTASRESESAFEALAPVMVVDRADIENSLAPDLADLLRFRAGIDIARSGGPGQQTSLFIRGTNSNHTVVLIDGVRINPGTLGTPAIQNIAPELVDHVEVVKGPLSTLYGTDAIGGVVNVITRRPIGDELGALVGYGRYGTRQAFASGQYAGAAGSVLIAAGYLDSTGFPTLAAGTRNRGYRDDSVALSARTALAGLELGARFWHSSGNTQYSDYYALTPLDQNYRNGSYAIDLGGQLADRWRSRATLARVTDDIRQVQPDDYDVVTPHRKDYAITNRNSLDWQNDVDLGAQLLTVGALLTREHARTLSFGTGYDVETRSDTWYLQDRVTLGRQRIQAAVGYARHDAFGDHTTWSAEYGFAPRPGTLLTAGVGTAFRAPNSSDLYGSGGNPALRPETSRNVELGLRQRIGARQTVTLAAFDNRVDSLIEFVSIPDPPYAQGRNIDRARIRGVEASWEWQDDAWRARLEATRQNPRDLTTDTLLLRRSRRRAAATLARNIGPHEVSLDLLAIGERLDYNYPVDVRLGGYLLANLAARFALAPGLSLQLHLENVLDHRYEYAYGYNTLRRSLTVAARYTFH